MRREGDSIDETRNCNNSSETDRVAAFYEIIDEGGILDAQLPILKGAKRAVCEVTCRISEAKGRFDSQCGVFGKFMPDEGEFLA